MNNLADRQKRERDLELKKLLREREEHARLKVQLEIECFRRTARNNDYIWRAWKDYVGGGQS